MLTFEVPLVRMRLRNAVDYSTSWESRQVCTITPGARSLALGCRMLRAVLSGEVDDFRTIARRMGISHARVSVLVALTYLSPRLQEELLLGTAEPLSFENLLKIARVVDWKAQESMADEARLQQRLWGEKSRMGSTEDEMGRISRPKTSQRVGNRLKQCPTVQHESGKDSV